MAKASALSDPFDTLDTAVWSVNSPDYPGEVRVSGGQLVIDNAAGYPSLTSVAAYDLRASSVTVQVAARPPAVNGIEAGFSLIGAGAADGTSLQLFITAGNGNLLGRILTQGSTTSSAYNSPSTTSGPLWLRIRHVEDGTTNGALVFDASGDGGAFLDTLRVAAPADLSTVYVQLYAGNYIGGTQASGVGATSYADVNLPAPASVRTATLRALGAATVVHRGTAAPSATSRTLGAAVVVHRGTRAATGTVRALASSVSVHRTTRTATATTRTLASASSTGAHRALGTATTRITGTALMSSARVTLATALTRLAATATAASTRAATGSAPLRVLATATTRSQRAAAATALVHAAATATTSTLRAAAGTALARLGATATTTGQRASAGLGALRATAEHLATTTRTALEQAVLRLRAAAVTEHPNATADTAATRDDTPPGEAHARRLLSTAPVARARLLTTSTGATLTSPTGTARALPDAPPPDTGGEEHPCPSTHSRPTTSSPP